MRRLGMLGLGAVLGTILGTSMEDFPIINNRAADFRQPKRRRTGKKHTQHCGTRQTARYTRQLAAGQISFIKHGPRAA